MPAAKHCSREFGVENEAGGFVVWGLVVWDLVFGGLGFRDWDLGERLSSMPAARHFSWGQNGVVGLGGSGLGLGFRGRGFGGWGRHLLAVALHCVGRHGDDGRAVIQRLPLPNVLRRLRRIRGLGLGLGFRV